MERSYGFPSNLNLVEKGLRYLKIWVQLQSHRFAIGSLVLSEPIAITCCVNFGARFIKFLAIVSLALSNPIAVTCCNFGVRFTQFLAIVNLVLSDPIAVTCCVNFGARFTKFLASYFPTCFHSC